MAPTEEVGAIVLNGFRALADSLKILDEVSYA
jgi:hypothetical protein